MIFNYNIIVFYFHYSWWVILKFSVIGKDRRPWQGCD